MPSYGLHKCRPPLPALHLPKKRSSSIPKAPLNSTDILLTLFINRLYLENIMLICVCWNFFYVKLYEKRLLRFNFFLDSLNFL